MTELFEIKNVEIFSAGNWNNREITEADLTELADNYQKTAGTVSPFLKFGHNEQQQMLKDHGLPAAGWVSNVRKVGKKLVADFVDIPKEVFKLIKNKAYKKVSVEILNSIDIAGTKYSKLLTAVALLGSETPAVLNLKDILANYTLTNKFNAHTYSEENSPDIIELSIKDSPETFQMELQEKLDAATAELEAEKAKALDLAAKANEMAEKYSKLEAEKIEADKVIAKAKADQAAAEADKFVTELVSDKLCSKAMGEMVKAVIGPEVEKYSVAGTEFGKKELVKELLKHAAKNAKVNFSATTTESKEDGELSVEKVEKYAKDNGIEYRDAYKVLSKKTNQA